MDIPNAFGVGEPVKLERLLYTLAGQVAGLLSFANVSRTVGLSEQAVGNYIRYMEQSSLIFLLPNYAPREETIQRRGRKLYFVDGAVRNAALERGIGPLEDPAEMGFLLENAAAAHLYALSQQTRTRLYYWRHSNFEVDFVYDDPREPMAFEIASSSRHDLSSLQAFQEQNPKFAGRCFLVSLDPIAHAPAAIKTGGLSVGRLPLDWFLMAVGAQADRALRQRLGSAQPPH
jgi:predicted AAA+ superfamily ATPase